MDGTITRSVVAILALTGSASWCGSNAQSVDLSVHGFRSDVTVPISDLTKLSLEYHRLYLNQASNLDFSAYVTNLGSDSAVNVLVSVEVFQYGSSQDYFLSGTMATLSPGASDTVVINADWDVPFTGEFELVFHATSSMEDANEANDVDTLSMVVDPDVSMRSDDAWSDTMRCHSNERIAVRYEFVDDGQVLGLWFVLPEQTGLLENTVIAQLLDQDLNELTSVGVSLSPSMFSEPGESNSIFVLFPNDISVPAETDFYAAIMSLDSTLVLAASGTCAESSVYQVNETGEEVVERDKLPLIGLFHYYEGIPEQSLSGISIEQFTPDPAQTSTRVSYTIRESGSPRIDLTRTDGALVRSTKLNNLVQGGHSYELDVSALPPGLYTCSILLNGQQATKRFVVVH